MLAILICMCQLDKVNLRINCIQSLLFVHGLLWLNFTGPANQRLTLGRSRTLNLYFQNLLCPSPCIQSLTGSFAAETRVYKVIVRQSTYLCSWQVDSQTKCLMPSLECFDESVGKILIQALFLQFSFPLYFPI